MADISATIASQLAQAAQTIQRSPPPKPEAKTEEAGSKDTPSVKVDSGLLATLSVDESEAPADAKAAKNFAEADRIRKLLLEQGIVLKDSATGTTWEASQ